MRPLFEITQDFETLYDLIHERGGDITDPDIAKIIDDFFAELNSDLETKADNYAAFIKELEHRAEARRAESDRLMKRVRIDANLADGLKERLRFGLVSIGRKKVETNRFKIIIAGNGGKLPILYEHEEDIPEDFYDQIPTLNRDRLREALESGESVPGVKLGERGTHLRIS